MNRVFGHIKEFALVKQDRSSTIIGWDYKEVGDGVNATWNEAIIYKKQVWNPRFQDIKNAVIESINKDTDYKILTGFVWNNIHVYLSIENQRNFSEAYHMAQSSSSILPITFKLGEDENEEPVYYTFTTVEELTSFYTQAFAYINQCLNEGW